MARKWIFLKKCCYIIVTLCPSWLLAQDYQLASPNGQNILNITCGEEVGFTVVSHQSPILEANHIQLVLADQTLGADPKVIDAKRSSVDKVIQVEVPTKYQKVRNQYNQIELKFKGNYSLVFRAFNNGIAYRFVGYLKEIGRAHV